MGFVHDMLALVLPGALFNLVAHSARLRLRRVVSIMLKRLVDRGSAIADPPWGRKRLYAGLEGALALATMSLRLVETVAQSDRLRTNETLDQASVTREGEDSRRRSFSSMACTDSPVSIAVELAMLRISRRLAASVSRK